MRPPAEVRAKAIDAAKKVDGWMTERELGCLFDMAYAAKGPIIEIGSWRGRSTVALALGSMAGSNQPVYAVDPFIGVPPTDRPSASGDRQGWHSSSPTTLRTNLAMAGVNGTVHIVAKMSKDALDEVPSECGLLFVDGDHKYDAVSEDLRLYMPKVIEGGTLLIHDCWEIDPGVVKAVDEQVFGAPNSWRVRGRIDSALLATRQATIRRQVMLAFPGSNMCFGAAKGLLQATLGAHDVTVVNSSRGWDDMNVLWTEGVNAAMRGKFTHFAMLHSDVVPTPGWIETLLCELDDLGADLVSTVIPIKDNRGVTSTGIGDKDDHWNPYRRLTMKEVMKLPPTFSIKDTPHPDRYLLHNTGCWACDLCSEVFHALDDEGCLRACFAFPIRTHLLNGELVHERESEDWYFSRQLAALGAKTYATRKVAVVHEGGGGFTNTEPWGTYEVDEDTALKWDGRFKAKIKNDWTEDKQEIRAGES